MLPRVRLVSAIGLEDARGLDLEERDRLCEGAICTMFRQKVTLYGRGHLVDSDYVCKIAFSLVAWGRSRYLKQDSLCPKVTHLL